VKKLILLLLLSLGFIGFSYAGGDDRDQEEFLNEPAEVVEEEAKSLLESSQGEAKQASENADEIKKVIAEIEHQLQENEKEINEASEQEKEDYIDSYQGRFIMLSIFILIIIAMYFIRRRLSKVRLDGD
jgi:CHASE3 domain sensor protein